MPWMWQRPNRRVERSGEDHGEFVFARRGEDESSGGPSGVPGDALPPPLLERTCFLYLALFASPRLTPPSPSLQVSTASSPGVLPELILRNRGYRWRRGFNGKADQCGGCHGPAEVRFFQRRPQLFFSPLLLLFTTSLQRRSPRRPRPASSRSQALLRTLSSIIQL